MLSLFVSRRSGALRRYTLADVMGTGAGLAEALGLPAVNSAQYPQSMDNNDRIPDDA